MTQNLGQII